MANSFRSMYNRIAPSLGAVLSQTQVAASSRPKTLRGTLHGSA